MSHRTELEGDQAALHNSDWRGPIILAEPPMIIDCLDLLVAFLKSRVPLATPLTEAVIADLELIDLLGLIRPELDSRASR